MNLCSVEAFRVGEGVCPSFVRRRMQSWFYSLESEHGEHSAEPSSREEPNPSSLPSLPFLIREVAAFWFLKSKGLRNGGASCGALGWPLATWESEPLPHALRSCANSGEKASSEFKTFSPKCRGGRSAADEGGKGRVAGGSGGEGLGAEEVVAQAFFGKLQEEDAASAAFSSQTRLSSAYPMTALACLVTTALRLQTLATSAPSKHLPDGPSFGEALAASQRFSCEETADAFQTNPALQQTATACEQEEPKGPSEGNMLSAGGLLLQALEDESARAEAQLLRCFAVVQEAGFLSDFRRAAAGASSARVRNTLCTAQAVKRFASLPHFPPCDCEVWQKEETPSFQTSDDDILTLRRDSACSALRKFRLCLRQRQSALRASGGLLQASEGGAPVESQLSPKPREEEAAHSSARPGAAVSPSQRSAKEACAERGMTKPSHEALSAAAKFESLKRRRQDDLGKGTERLPAEGKPQFRKSPSVGGARTPSAKHEASLCLERSAAVVTRAVFAFCLGSLSRLPPPHLLLWQRMWTRRRSQEQAELHRAASSPLRLLSEDDCPLRDGTAAPTPAGALSQETTLPHPSAKKPLFKVAAGGALVKPEAASEATAQRRESLVLRLQRSPTALGMKAALRARGAREKSETREEEQVPSSRRGPAVVRLVARGVKRQKLQEEPTPDAATGADRRCAAQQPLPRLTVCSALRSRTHNQKQLWMVRLSQRLSILLRSECAVCLPSALAGVGPARRRSLSFGQ